MDVVTILIFLSVFLTTYLFVSKQKGLAPGPYVLPVIGSNTIIKQLSRKPKHLVFCDVAKKYGNIFSMQFGKQIMIVLNGYEAVHEALVKHADRFCDRPNFLPSLAAILKNVRGIILESHNQKWKTMRRFTLQALRDCGVGKYSIESKIMVEVDAASEYLDATRASPTEPTALLQMMIGNIIYDIVFGKRFNYDDPDFELVRSMTGVAVSGQGIGNPANFFPKWLTNILNKKAEKFVAEKRENFIKVNKFIYGMIEEHEETFDKDNIRDFVDLYLQMSRSCDDDSKDIFPEICERQLEYADRGKLVYIEATLMEIQRLGNTVPLAVPHTPSEDTTLMGYTIPKNAMVIPNLYSVSMDPDYWQEPTKFNPSRFLDKTGKLMKKEALIPFSAGPRTCLGEPLARMELFLVFTNLLQRFTFAKEDPGVSHSMDVRPNQITNSPLPYKFRATRR